MSCVMTDRQLDGKPAIEQAKSAIAHVLRTIQENPEAAYQLGVGTQSWALLTEAASTLFGEDLAAVREKLKPKLELPTAHQCFQEITKIVNDHVLVETSCGESRTRDRVCLDMIKAVIELHRK